MYLAKSKRITWSNHISRSMIDFVLALGLFMLAAYLFSLSDRSLYNASSVHWALSCGVLSLAFSGVRWHHFPKYSFALFYLPILLLAMTFLFATPLWTEANKELKHYYEQLKWISLVFLLLATMRPSFLIGIVGFKFYAYYLHKQANQGFVSSITDFASVAEALLFFLILMCSLIVVMQLRLQFKHELRFGVIRRCKAILLYMVLFYIAVHFVNYWMAGITKVKLDGGYLSWVFENPTYRTLARAALLDGLPSSMVKGEFGVLIYQFLVDYNVLLNAFVFAMQLLCVFSFANKKLIILFCILFDIFHLVVFGAASILFYKWIVVNLVIAYFVTKNRLMKCNVQIAAVIALLCIFYIPDKFRFAKLGWYETAQAEIIEIKGYYEDGNIVDVPYSFLLDGSFKLITFFRPYSIEFEGLRHGATVKSEVMRKSNKCDNPPIEKTARIADEKLLNDVVNRVFQKQLKLDNLEDYIYYPFHFFSSVGNFSDFFAKDLAGLDRLEFRLNLYCDIQIEQSGAVGDLIAQESIFVELIK